MNLSLIRTDHVQRFNFFVDVDAIKFTAVRIELFPHRPLVVPAGTNMTQQELLLEALRSLRWLRSQPSHSPYPPSVLRPFAKLIAVDLDNESRELQVRHQMHIGDTAFDGDERVQALCRAWDLVDGAPLPVGEVWN